jgi:hypothetical protein
MRHEKLFCGGGYLELRIAGAGIQRPGGRRCWLTRLAAGAVGKPGTEDLLLSTHVQAYFTHECLGDHHVDAIDPRLVHSRDALQFAPELESRSILGWFYSLSLGFHFWWRKRDGICKTCHSNSFQVASPETGFGDMCYRKISPTT